MISDCLSATFRLEVTRLLIELILLLFLFLLLRLYLCLFL